MRIETIRGHIVGCSKLEEYVKPNGELAVKCALHIVSSEADNSEPLGREDDYAGHTERAITCSGGLTNWLGCIGSLVEVKYVHRVFSFSRRNGKGVWYGNDLYAVSIRSI